MPSDESFWGFFNRRRGDREAFDRQVDAVVEAVDPRLRMASGYRRRLAPALREAIQVIDAQFTELPPPIEVARERWSGDPFLRAAFTSPDTMQAVFDGDRSLRRFLASEAAQGARAVYAALGMSLDYNQRFGHALQGETIQRDVAQRVLTLGDHRLSAFTADAERLGETVRQRVLQEVVLRATRAVQDVRNRKVSLDEQRIKLQMRLHMREQEAAGEAGLWRDEDEARRQADALRAELAAMDAELDTLRTTDIDDYLDDVVEIFASMETDVSLETRQVNIDAMNICHEAPGEGTSALSLTVAHLADRPPRVVRLVAFAPGFVGDDDGDGLERAARTLGVR